MKANWVRGAVEHAGISGAELARRLTAKLGRSIDRAAVNKMMVDQTGRKPRKVSVDELLAIEEITGFPAPLEAKIKGVSVPVLSWVSAGRLAAADGMTPADIERWMTVAELPDGDWIALAVSGDSMDRVAPGGSTIIVNRRERQLVPGGYFVIETEEGATFKLYRVRPQRFEPFSTNPSHETLFPEGRVRVVGRVRRVITELE
jgi:SOS-response transcriptional repressor LexA